MSQHCYHFSQAVSLAEVEATLLLSAWATEALHGESQFELDAHYDINSENRSLLIDAGTDVGRDLNRILVGFLRREFPKGDFRVERRAEPEPVPL